jgi:hypothetical protein
VIAVIVGWVATQIPKTPTPTTTTPAQSPYVEVDYKTIGWFFDNGYITNDTYLLINITMRNDGYSKEILSDPWGFNVTINDVSYSDYGLGSIPVALYNGTGILETAINYSSGVFNYTTGTFTYSNYTYKELTNFASNFSALPDVSLANGGIISGTIAFEVKRTSQFTLGYVTYFADYSLPNPTVKIFQK